MENSSLTQPSKYFGEIVVIDADDLDNVIFTQIIEELGLRQPVVALFACLAVLTRDSRFAAVAAEFVCFPNNKRTAAAKFF